MTGPLRGLSCLAPSSTRLPGSGPATGHPSACSCGSEAVTHRRGTARAGWRAPPAGRVAAPGPRVNAVNVAFVTRLPRPSNVCRRSGRVVTLSSQNLAASVPSRRVAVTTRAWRPATWPQPTAATREFVLSKAASCGLMLSMALPARAWPPRDEGGRTMCGASPDPCGAAATVTASVTRPGACQTFMTEVAGPYSPHAPSTSTPAYVVVRQARAAWLSSRTVGRPEVCAGESAAWREITAMPLTTRPASTATVIRRSDTGSVPGPDVPTAGRERVSIQGSPAHGRLGRALVPDPGKARRAAQRGGRRRAHLDAAGAELVLQHVHVHRGGNAGAGL